MQVSQSTSQQAAVIACCFSIPADLPGMQSLVQTSEPLTKNKTVLSKLVEWEIAENCWILALCRGGDEIHLLHIVPRLQRSSSFGGAPPVDFLPQQDPVAHDQLIRRAEAFIRHRFLPKLAGLKPEPVVHIVKVSWIPVYWHHCCLLLSVPFVHIK